jgi:hypothetical protein
MQCNVECLLFALSRVRAINGRVPRGEHSRSLLGTAAPNPDIRIRDQRSLDRRLSKDTATIEQPAKWRQSRLPANKIASNRAVCNF